jgi:hypothetical protein
MKITKKELNNLINEEIESMLQNGEIDEGFLGRSVTRARAAAGKLKDKAVGTYKGGMAGLKGDVKGVKAAAAQKKGAEEKALAVKAARTVRAHSEAMQKDLDALGVLEIYPEVRRAITALNKIVQGKIGQKAGIADKPKPAAKPGVE